MYVVLILHTCHQSSPEGFGRWQSHTPAGTWCPAELHIPGSVFPGHPGYLPPELPGYGSDPGSGPAGLCSGPLSQWGCTPGNLSTEGEEDKFKRWLSFNSLKVIVKAILNNSFFVTTLMALWVLYHFLAKYLQDNNDSIAFLYPFSFLSFWLTPHHFAT